MTRQQLLEPSDAQLWEILGNGLSPHTPAFLFGSRACRDHRRNSDFDFCNDVDTDPSRLIDERRNGQAQKSEYTPGLALQTTKRTH